MDKRTATARIAEIVKEIHGKFDEAELIANAHGVDFRFDGPRGSYRMSGRFIPQNWNYSDEAVGNCGGGAEWVTSSDNC